MADKVLATVMSLWLDDKERTLKPTKYFISGLTHILEMTSTAFQAIYQDFALAIPMYD